MVFFPVLARELFKFHYFPMFAPPLCRWFVMLWVGYGLTLVLVFFFSFLVFSIFYYLVFNYFALVLYYGFIWRQVGCRLIFRSGDFVRFLSILTEDMYFSWSTDYGWLDIFNIHNGIFERAWCLLYSYYASCAQTEFLPVFGVSVNSFRSRSPFTLDKKSLKVYNWVL